MSVESHADILNRQIFPLGDKSCFMANTGTGDSSAGSVYYNPGSLIGSQSKKLSISGSAYFKFSIKFDAVSHIDNTDIPYEATGFNTIPSTVVSTFKKEDWYFAFSTLIPSSIQIESKIQQRTSTLNLTIHPNSFERELWVGLTAARKIDDQWSAGFSLFGIQATKNTNNSAFMQLISNPSAYIVSMQNTSYTVYGFSGVFGVWYRPSDYFDFGLRFQSPLYPVASDATVYNNGVIDFSTPTITIEDEKGLKANYQLPPDATIGMAYRATSKLNFLLDISHQWGVDYMEIPDYSQTEAFHTRPTFRANVGFEYELSEKSSVLAGVYYNPSAMKPLNEINDNIGNTKMRIDMWGYTAGFFFTDEHIQSGIGGFYLQGSGATKLGPPYYYIKGVSANAIGAVLTTSYIF